MVWRCCGGTTILTLETTRKNQMSSRSKPENGKYAAVQHRWRTVRLDLEERRSQLSTPDPIGEGRLLSALSSALDSHGPRSSRDSDGKNRSVDLDLARVRVGTAKLLAEGSLTLNERNAAGNLKRELRLRIAKAHERESLLLGPLASTQGSTQAKGRAKGFSTLTSRALRLLGKVESDGVLSHQDSDELLALVGGGDVDEIAETLSQPDDCPSPSDPEPGMSAEAGATEESETSSGRDEPLIFPIATSR